MFTRTQIDETVETLRTQLKATYKRFPHFARPVFVKQLREHIAKIEGAA